MSKIDWVEAELKYVTKAEASYDWLAQLFGVAKTTIVRRASKDEWPKKRKEYTEKRIIALEERTLQDRVAVEERQLKTLRMTQTLFHNAIVRIGHKEQNGEPVSSKELQNMANMTSAMTKAIMMERTILGLPTKPVRITNAEAIENVQRIMGVKVEPLDQKYRETKALLEGIDVDAIMKHKRILEKYVKKVEETGDVSIEHPLW